MSRVTSLSYATVRPGNVLAVLPASRESSARPTVISARPDLYMLAAGAHRQQAQSDRGGCAAHVLFILGGSLRVCENRQCKIITRQGPGG